MSLLARAQSNDQEAWNQIVHLYGPLVHKWCRRASLNDDDIADVFQESFRAVSSHLENFAPTRSVGSFRSWLRTIVRTKVADHFRRVNRQPVGTGGSDAQMRMSGLPDPLGDDDDEEEADEEHTLLVQRAMELIRPEFTKRNGNAFIKVAIDGHSAIEVANELSVNAQAIRQANYRIRRRLRLVLQDLIE
jgi:RNA polymerase sigma-70 factor (ECF subfamily)